MDSENKDHIIFFHWSSEVVLLTVGITLLSMFWLISILKSDAPPQAVKYLLAALLFAPVISGLFIAPLYVKINDELIQIRRPVSSVEIPIEHIISIKKINISEINNAVRLFGSGGCFGYIGYFRNTTLGKFIMYSTEKTNLVQIQTDDKRYVISCRNPELLISKLK